MYFYFSGIVFALWSQWVQKIPYWNFIPLCFTKLYLTFGSIHSMNSKTTIHLQCQKRLWPHCHTIDATSKWVEINSERTFLFYCKFSFDLKEMRWISRAGIYLINIFTHTWPWYCHHHGQTIHPTENFISINLIIILCFLTWA